MSLNLLFYGVDGLRGTLIAGAHLGLLTNFIILLAVTLVLSGIGSYLFSKTEV
jgi:ABC-type polysaccharide/polyol phosphate export permease